MEECRSLATKIGDVLLEILILIDLANRFAVRRQSIEKLVAEDHNRVPLVALSFSKIGDSVSSAIFFVVVVTEYNIPII